MENNNKNVEIEFEGIRSSSKFLKSHYFSNIDKYYGNKRFMNQYVQEALRAMVEDQVIPESDGSFGISDNATKVKVMSKRLGLSINTSVNSDFTQKTTLSICNPFGKGGEFGGEGSLSIYKTVLGSIYYKDRFSNRIEFSKKIESPTTLNGHIKTTETSLSFQPKIFGRNFLSFYAGERHSFATGNDKDEELKSHLGVSNKLSLTHRYYYYHENNDASGFWGRLTTELAGGIESARFIKSETLNHFYIPIGNGFYFESLIGLGALFNFSNGLSPYNDRFFNGQSYYLKGFNFRGLTTTRNKKIGYGGDFYHNTSIYLTKDIHEKIQLFLFAATGNSVLNYGNIKTSLKDLVKIGNWRQTVGFGLRAEMGPAFVDVYFGKVLRKLTNDKTHTFGFNITLKI